MSSQPAPWNAPRVLYQPLEVYNYPAQYLPPDQGVHTRWQPEVAPGFYPPPEPEYWRANPPLRPQAGRYSHDPHSSYPPTYAPPRCYPSPIRYHEPVSGVPGLVSRHAPSPHLYHEARLSPVIPQSAYTDVSQELPSPAPVVKSSHPGRYVENPLDPHTHVHYFETPAAPSKYAAGPAPHVEMGYAPSAPEAYLPDEGNSVEPSRGQSVVRRMVLSREPLHDMNALSPSERYAATVASVSGVRQGMIHRYGTAVDQPFRPNPLTFDENQYQPPSRPSTSLTGIRRAPHMGTEVNIPLPPSTMEMVNDRGQSRAWTRPGRTGPNDLMLEPANASRTRRLITGTEVTGQPSLRPASAQLRPLHGRAQHEWVLQPEIRATPTSGTPTESWRNRDMAGRTRSTRNLSHSVTVRACAVQQMPSYGSDSARCESSRPKQARTPKGSERGQVDLDKSKMSKRGRAVEDESITTTDSGTKGRSNTRKREKPLDSVDLAALLANVTGSLNEQQLPVLDQIKSAVTDLAAACRTLAAKRSELSGQQKRQMEASASRDSDVSRSTNDPKSLNDPLASSKVIDELTDRVSQKVVTKVLASLLKSMAEEKDGDDSRDKGRERGRALSWTERSGPILSRSPEPSCSYNADAQSAASSVHKPDMHTYAGPFGMAQWSREGKGTQLERPSTEERSSTTGADDGSRIAPSFTGPVRRGPSPQLPEGSELKVGHTAPRRDEKRGSPNSEAIANQSTTIERHAKPLAKADEREVVFSLRIDTFCQPQHEGAGQLFQPVSRHVEVVRIKEYLFVACDLFTEAECNHLLNEIPLQWDVNPIPGVITDTSRRTDGFGRIMASSQSTRAGSIYTAMVKRGATPLSARLERRLAAASKCKPTQITRLMLMKYSPGAYLGQHFEGEGVHKTALVFLNAMEGRGGEHIFSKLGLQVRPKKGTALMWQDDSAEERLPSPLLVHADRPTEHDEKILLLCHFRRE